MKKPTHFKMHKSFIIFLSIILPWTGYQVIKHIKRSNEQERISTHEDIMHELKKDLLLKIQKYQKEFRQSSEEYKKLRKYEKEVDYCRDKEEIHELERKALTL